MKDLRTLCDEAIQLWDADCEMEGVINEMRDYLAQPEPEWPTDEEIADEARKYLVNEYELPAEITYLLDSDNFEYEPTIGCFRAILTRWGRPAIQPMPINNTQE